MHRLVLLALVTGSAACSSPAGIECPINNPSYCNVHTGGVCLVSPTGRDYCAYPNASCASGYVWGEGSPGSISGICTDQTVDAGGPDVTMVPDGGTSDAMPVFSTTHADLVLGQNGYTTNTINSGGLTGKSMHTPSAVAGTPAGLWVSDANNARVLQWMGPPVVPFVTADHIIGQASPTASSPGTTQSVMQSGWLGGYSDGTHICVADTSSNRVLYWNTPPSADGANACLVFGQSSFTGSTAAVTQSGLSNPFGCWTNGSTMVVADTGANRVLIWSNINQIACGNAAGNAAHVLGQVDFMGSGHASPPTPRSMYIPSAVYYDGARLFVADTDNHRVMIFNGIPTSDNANADSIVGQSSVNGGNPNAGGASPNRYGFNQPTGIVASSDTLFVADYMNHRVLAFRPMPTGTGAPAYGVLGSDFDHAGTATVVSDSTFNAPAGVSVIGAELYVADSGNNRVLRFPFNP